MRDQNAARQSYQLATSTWSAQHKLLGTYRSLAALLILVYDVYQYMRSGPESRYPYDGTVWHSVLVSLDGSVGLFFLLSAYLLGLPYARAALYGTPPTTGTAFLFRRVVRVVPLYAVSIVVVWAARNQQFPGDWKDLAEHLTFTQVFDNKRIFFTNGPAWAIAVEMQFYVLLAVGAPALCSKCRQLTLPRQRLALLLRAAAVMAAVSVAWKLGAYYIIGVQETTWSVWFSLPAKLDIFAIGLMLAALTATRSMSVPVSTSRRLQMAGGGLVILVGAVSLRSTISIPPYVYFHTVAAVGLALLVVASVRPVPRKFVTAQGQRTGIASGLAVGITSYSLYLWHEPMMLLLADHGLFPKPGSRHAFVVGVLILAPLACVAAWASYWVIEYPTSMVRRTRNSSGIRRNYYAER